MKTYIGEKGLDQTWQWRHSETTKCKYCGKVARIGFVVMEDERDEDGDCVADLFPVTTDPGNYWPHDFISVAIYFCPVCGEITAIWNQG